MTTKGDGRDLSMTDEDRSASTTTSTSGRKICQQDRDLYRHTRTRQVPKKEISSTSVAPSTSCLVVSYLLPPPYSVFTLMMICGRASFETRHGPFFGVVLDLKRTKCPRRYTSRKQRPPSEQAGSPSGILEAILSIKLYTKLRYLPTVYTSLRYTASHQSILTALFTTVFSSAWYIREAYITTLRPTDQVSCYLSSESHWLWL